jgi:DNA-binding response OmpR family regulator
VALPRLLIVDDQVEVLKLILRTLAPGKYAVRMAGDGVEALTLARESTPDLIITDVNMPRMDGWTLVKHMRSTAALALVPVIFLTGQSASEDHIRGYRLGADDYIDKTTSFGELPARVDRALAKHRELDATVAPGTSTPGLAGRCDVIGLASLLTILDAGRRSGILRLRRTSPAEEGLIFVVEGRVHRAELRPGKARNRDVVFELLRWTSGTFDFTSSELRVADDVQGSTAQLLVEGARRIDEP